MIFAIDPWNTFKSAESHWKTFLDGAYESQMKFFPPPLTMAIFSIIEVAIFVYDIVSTQ